MKTYQVFLTFHPRLKPHFFKPSEDNPTEYLLVLKENGATLGVSLQEKRLLQLLEGQYLIRDIINKMVEEQIAPLALLKKLLWDLDRYGFLEESPWLGKHEIEDWGYWGFSTSTCTPFTFYAFFSPLEEWIGKILRSPYFSLFSFLFLLFSLFYENKIFIQVPPFLLNHSVATGILVVLVLVLGLCVFSSLTMLLVLRSIHPAPARGLIDYRYGIPVFRLDGRRIRVLPWNRVFFALLSPVMVLLLFSGICLLLAGNQEGIGKEWLFHCSLSCWIVSFLLTSPWISSVSTREVLLRLRGESSFWTMTQALQYAFQHKKRFSNVGITYQRLFLGWGVLSLVTTLSIFFFGVMALPWDWSYLFQHFLQEENPVIITILFLFLSLGGAAIAATIVTFLVWLTREIHQEIYYRWMPQRDIVIAGILFILALFFTTQILWSGSVLHLFTPKFPILFWSVILTFAGIYFRLKEGKGYETRVPLFLGAAGLLVSFHSFELTWFEGFYNHLEMSQYVTLTIFQENYRDTVSLLFFGVVLYFCFYLLRMYCFKFQLKKPFYNHVRVRMAILLSGILLSVVIGITFPIQNTMVEKTEKFLFCFFVIYQTFLFCAFGNLRNHSTMIIAMSLLLITGGLLPWQQQGIGSLSLFLKTTGFILGLCGLFLRYSSLAKTSLGQLYKGKKQLASKEWDLPAILGDVLKSSEEFYGIQPKIVIPPEINEEITRRILHHLFLLTGPKSMRAIVRRFALFAPWTVTRTLCGLLPVSVDIPRLSDWTINRLLLWLKKVPSFYYAGDEVNHVTATARFAFFDAGNTLAHQNETEGFLFVVLDGLLAAQNDYLIGHSVLAIFKPGDFVGEIGFLSGARRTASIRALQPALVLMLHRDDVDSAMPAMQSAMQSAESGEFWLQALSQSPIFKEYPASLSARVCLEGRFVHLNSGDSFRFENQSASHSIAIFLSGKGSILKEGKTVLLEETSLIGLGESLEETPLHGLIRAEEPCHLLLIDRELFLESLIELITPRSVIEYAEEIGMFQPINE